MIDYRRHVVDFTYKTLILRFYLCVRINFVIETFLNMGQNCPNIFNVPYLFIYLLSIIDRDRYMYIYIFSVLGIVIICLKMYMCLDTCICVCVP